MKRKLHEPLAALAARTRQAAARGHAAWRWLALAPAVALTASPVWAALPTVTAPTTGIGTTTCTDGDVMCYFGYYFKELIQVLAIVIPAMYLIYFGLGALSRWRAYSSGREDASALKEFSFIGGLVAALIVLTAWLANNWATT